MDTNLVYIDDLDTLRHKLNNARAPLDRYWAHYLELAATEPIGEFQALPPLAYLITGDPRYRESVRSVMLNLLDTLPLADASLEAQFHAYTACAPIARFAVYLDWMWDLGVFTHDELEALSANMVTQVYSHCYLRLKGRLPSGDNQQASMAYACAVTGYVFGVKRGRSKAAQEMFAAGVNRYYGMLQVIGEGGWCGEGSVYHVHVFAPVLALYTAFMEQIAGRDFCNMRLGESCVADNFRVGSDIINHAGMLPAWDAARNLPPELKTHLVYYARRTGDLQPLAQIVEYGLWSEGEILAWYNDDKVWSLIFWPDEQPEIPQRRLDSWLNPPVAARLCNDSRDVELFQMWDVMGPGLPGRANINPNSVELCCHGNVLTVDGMNKTVDDTFFTATAEDMFDAQQYADLEQSVRGWAMAYGGDSGPDDPAEFAVKVADFANMLVKSSAPCQLKAHSCIVVDNEGHRYLPHESRGEGSGFVDLPLLKAARGDVSKFYNELWGISQMHRSSLVIDDRLILMVDQFAADDMHDYTWQLMLRPSVSVSENQARQEVREGAKLALACPSNQRFGLQEVSGITPVFEQKAHCLSIHQTVTGDGQFAVVMRPEPGRHVVKDLSPGWAVSEGETELPAGLFERDATVSLAGEYLGAPPRTDTLWFGQTVVLSEAEVANAERLVIREGQLDRLDVFVNGQQAEEAFEHLHLEQTRAGWTVHKNDARFSESHFLINDLLKPGENRIAIASSEFRGCVVKGPVELIALEPASDVGLSIEPDGKVWRLEDGQGKWWVLADNAAGEVVALPDNIETDAERVVSGQDVLALGAVSSFVSSDWQLESSVPVAVQRRSAELHVDCRGCDDGKVLLRAGDRELTISIGASITCTGGLEGDLWVRCEPGLSVFHNGEVVVLASEGGWLKLDASAATAADAGSAYEVGWRMDKADIATLLAVGTDVDWRSQTAAAERCGREGWQEAIPHLLRLYEAEEQAELYSPVNGNWPFSKMKTTFVGWADPDFPEPAKRRHRLKTVILEALGRLGDAEQAGGVIHRTLERPADFYPVLVQAAIAAVRLDLRDAVPLLDKLTGYNECNAANTAKLACAYFRGELSRFEFECKLAD